MWESALPLLAIALRLIPCYNLQETVSLFNGDLCSKSLMQIWNMVLSLKATMQSSQRPRSFLAELFRSLSTTTRRQTSGEGTLEREVLRGTRLSCHYRIWPWLSSYPVIVLRGLYTESESEETLLGEPLRDTTSSCCRRLILPTI